MTGPISTSPKAMQAYKLIKRLDPLIGTIEAAFFMQRANENLAGITPVDAIKAGRVEDVDRAVTIVAIEKGLFEEPFLPPTTGSEHE
jgi:hypothetical protein